MTKGKSQQDVIIIGGGITGLSTAYHLLKAGIKRIAVLDPEPPKAVTGQALGILAGGQTDNFTRLKTAHGSDFAARLWRFGDEAFLATLAFLEEQNLPFSRSQRLRLVMTPEELVEVTEAVKAMNAADTVATLWSKKEAAGRFSSLGEGVLAVQDEGAMGALTEALPLLERLRKCSGHSLVKARAVAVKTGVNKVDVQCDNGQLFEGEIVVLANHLGIREFLPALKEVFVPVVEQAHFFETKGKMPETWSKKGAVISAFHNYYWGGLWPDGRIGLGGGRFLRPMAGIGFEQAQPEPKVTSQLTAQLSKFFPWIDAAHVKTTFCGLDCRPCDELPVIGPMFGEERILVAGGYMGNGLTLGFFAGRCLADLIQKGRCPALPDRVTPSRLRSLS